MLVVWWGLGHEPGLGFGLGLRVRGGHVVAEDGEVSLRWGNAAAWGVRRVTGAGDEADGDRVGECGQSREKYIVRPSVSAAAERGEREWLVVS